MSEDMRKMIDRVKNFKQFVNDEWWNKATTWWYWKSAVRKKKGIDNANTKAFWKPILSIFIAYNGYKYTMFFSRKFQVNFFVS